MLEVIFGLFVFDNVFLAHVSISSFYSLYLLFLIADVNKGLILLFVVSVDFTPGFLFSC